MASARPTSFKKAGGFLNGVDGVLKDYEFTDQFPGGGESKSDFRSLYCILTILVDGADDDITTTLWAGGADDFEIEDNGHTLVPIADDGGLRGGTPFDMFLSSAIKNGFDENLLPEDSINYEAMLGRRYRFGQQDELDKHGQKKTRVAKKGKYKGKEFPVTVTVVEKAYDEEPIKGKPGKGKPAPVEEDDDADVVADVAAEVLKAILTKQKDQSISKTKLSAKIVEAMLKHKRKDLREDVRKYLFDDKHLASIDGVRYDKSDKNQTIALDE